MPHSLWTGSISFGLVAIPVGLFPATEDHSVRFHQYQAGTADRVRNLRVNERTGKEVPFKEIVKGYDLGDGRAVMITSEELESIAPKRSTTIEITDFVDLVDIDPIHFRSTYYLAPKSEAAAKPYALLLEAMRQTGKAGIAVFVMRNKEYLCALRGDRDVLTLETMYFADEIRDASGLVAEAVEGVTTNKRELSIATELIQALSGPWQPEAYHDEYVRQVEDLLKQKEKGEAVAVQHEEAAAAPVIDLMAALEQSVRRTRDDGAARTAAKARTGSVTARVEEPAPSRSRAAKAPAKRAPAKKAPARKAAASKAPASKAAGKTTKAAKPAARNGRTRKAS